MKTYFAYLSLLALGTVVEGYDYSLNAFTQTSTFTPLSLFTYSIIAARLASNNPIVICI